MIRIIKNRRKDIPEIDECRMEVMAFMDHESLRISVISELNRDHFFVYDWSTSKRMPSFLKDKMSELIDRFGVPLLEHCFLEWKKENPDFMRHSSKVTGSEK